MMSLREIVILRLLEPGEQYGAQLRKSHNEVMHRPVHNGALYTTLNRMVEKGWLRGRIVKSKKVTPRRFFKLTAEGKKKLKFVRGVLGV